ncbi:DUF4340 domain-containing protein [Patescibacteria group bacterium]|nr:DUF4340 domain-containing protein [Patescibacteria group bacterium]
MKKNVILTLTLILLAGGGYYLTRGVPWQKEALFFSKLAKETVNIIVIKTAEENEVRLEKRNNSWVVADQGSVPANQDRVDDILRVTTELIREELISENPDKQSDLQVNSSGTRVQLYQGDNVVADYYVGQVGPDFYSTYVRKEGEDKVYLVNKVLASVVMPLDWRNLTIMEFDFNEVVKLTVQNGDIQFALEKQDTEWKVVNSTESVDADKVMDIIYDLAYLKAEDIDISISTTDAGLDNPARQYQVELNSGVSQSLFIGNQVDDKIYVKSNGTETIYQIDSSVLEGFPQSLTDLQSLLP